MSRASPTQQVFASLARTYDTPDNAPLTVSLAMVVMAGWFASFTERSALLAELEAAGLAWAQLRDTTNLLESPSLRGGDVVTEVDDHAGGVRGVVRMAYRFSDADPLVRGADPQRGGHNGQVLSESIGASAATVDALIANGALLEPPSTLDEDRPPKPGS